MHPGMKKWLLAVLALAVLFGASALSPIVNARRQSEGLLAAPIEQSAQPSMMYAPLMAFGRAWLVDFLWLRATKLKEERRYFDAYQLSRMICELQPRFASVWAFQAWNMAYNISVTLKTPEERWRWVKNGIELLRDKAIPLNPHNTQLYKDLAWTFFHKVGDFTDEMHYYYKVQLALLVEDILGDPPDGFVGRGVVHGDFYRNYDFQALADAPRSWEAVAAQPGVADLSARLSAFGHDPRTPGIYLGLLAALRDGKATVPTAAPGDEENRLHALKTLMADPATEAPRKAIERYWRAHRLRTELRLDPERIIELQNAFGVTFDFRLAEAHALYWANLGVEMGADKRVALDVNKLNTNRIEFFALKKMFDRGRMAMSVAARRAGVGPEMNPDIRFGEILFETYIRDAAQYKKNPDGKPVDDDFFAGFVGFVRQLVERYAERGEWKKAQEKFDFLVKYYNDPVYAGGLEDFVTRQFLGTVAANDFPGSARRVGALTHKGLILLSYGEDEEAARYFARARQVYDRYQKACVSERMKFPFTMEEFIRDQAHVVGMQVDRQMYELVCQKLNIEPLPDPSTMPAPPEQAPMSIQG